MRQRAFCYAPYMTIQLIDTHCHLDFPVFDSWRDRALTDALAEGVDKIVVPGVVASDWPRLLQICSDEGLYPALGLHPCFIGQHQDNDLRLLSELLDSVSVVAVGEIGLDFFVEGLDQDRQIHIFEAQLKLAAHYELPVLLHVRKAHDQVLKRLRQIKLRRGGIVHAYSGSHQQALQYLELGFKLGVGGTLSYDRATKLRTLVIDLPLDSFVLETDAPDMPLADFRNEPNQPTRVRLVAEILANLRGISLAELSSQTTKTARALFEF